MNFAQPGLAVAALACASLPFLLHLLLRRPRATAWPSTMLLQRAIERLRRRRKIERWVLLAVRALALLLAGLAMAGPLLRSSGLQARERWIVVDDGATAAERLADGRTAIDFVREQARTAMQDLREGDRVALVSAAQPARVLLPPTVDLQRALREVDALQARAVPASWKDAVDLALPKAGEVPTTPREMVLVGTFRRGSVDPESPLPAAWKERAAAVRRWCTPAPVDGSTNRSIGEVRVARSTGEVTGADQVPVRVQLLRTAATSGDDSVIVKSSRGEALGRADAPWTTGASETRVDVPVRSGEGDALIVQVSPDAQPLDDSVSIASVPVREPTVLVLGRRSGDADLERLPASAWVMRALEAASLRPQEVDPTTLALRSFRDVDAVIACRPDLLDGAGWQWIGRFVQDGGTAVVMPVPELRTQAWHAEFARAIGREANMGGTWQQGSFRLAPRQPRTPILSLLGAEIDALAEPVTVTRRWPLDATPDVSTVLNFDDGTAAITLTRPREGRGVVVMLSTAPELACTDLPLKPMMVPLLQEIVRGGRWMAAADRQVRSGEVAALGPMAAGGMLQPSDVSQGSAIEMDAEGRTAQAVPSPGLWKLRARDGQEQWIAVRLDPAAARIDAVEARVLEAWRSGLAPWQDGVAGDASKGFEKPGESPWTPLLFLAALTLLLVEVPLGRQGSPRASATAEAGA